MGYNGANAAGGESGGGAGGSATLDGFVRVAAGTPRIRVADPDYNAGQALALARKAAAIGARFLCLPELCLTGSTCGDLFSQGALVDAAARALRRLAAEAAPLGVLVAVGLPIAAQGRLFNVAAVLGGGRVLGFVPKAQARDGSGPHGLRQSTPCLDAARGGHARARARSRAGFVNWGGADVPFGARIVFIDAAIPGFRLAVEIGEDLWAPTQPGAAHAAAGALVVANPSACGEAVGRPQYRRAMACGQSARLICGYVRAEAGHGESTQDMAFSGHNLICENGAVLSESPPFGCGWAASDIDLRSLEHDRTRMGAHGPAGPAGTGCLEGPAGTDCTVGTDGYLEVTFHIPIAPSAARGATPDAAPGTSHCAAPLRRVDPMPFVPEDAKELAERCELVLSIQAHGLAKRLEHTGSGHAAINVSGGLDSTLALLVAARAFALLGRPASSIVAATMPCFGTTERTLSNALRLCAALGVPCREIDISGTVRSHLGDISHPSDARDVVYENAQARMRTLALMDIANQCGGIAVGTGDLSELALGWTTYNADHMSMYGVNAGVPKTLAWHIVRHVADTCGDAALASALEGILATPASPELLPPSGGGGIGQLTESIVGPYALHDFFLYHTLRWGRRPRAVYALALAAFGRGRGGSADGPGDAEGSASCPGIAEGSADADAEGSAIDAGSGGRRAAAYAEAEIRKWLRVFYERFFSQQFKRSCMPDGPAVGSVSLSPRGGWQMPSDASRAAWLRELDALDAEPPR